MNADQHIAQAAARAAIAYRNGDDLLGDYWSERVQRLSDARERLTEAESTVARLDGYTQDQHQQGIQAALERLTAKREDRAARARAAVRMLSGLTDAEIDDVGGMPRCDTFDELKGSPDHSVLRNA